MQSKHGVATGEFGRWLAQQVSSSSRCQGYLVYYDHGDKSADPRVAAVKGFSGERVSNENRLADVDVIVAKPDGEVVLLVEIEERKVAPKKLLGDLMAIPMCSRFAVKTDIGHRYLTINPDTQFILAGVVSPRGSKLCQIQEVIAPRLGEFGRLSGGIDPQNVSLVFEGNIQKAIGVLRDRVRGLIPDKKPADWQWSDEDREKILRMYDRLAWIGRTMREARKQQAEGSSDQTTADDDEEGDDQEPPDE